MSLKWKRIFLLDGYFMRRFVEVGEEDSIVYVGGTKLRRSCMKNWRGQTDFCKTIRGNFYLRPESLTEIWIKEVGEGILNDRFLRNNSRQFLERDFDRNLPKGSRRKKHFYIVRFAEDVWPGNWTMLMPNRWWLINFIHVLRR